MLAALLALAACSGSAREGPPGLFTSLPILWAESERLGDLLKPQAAPHWALAVIERDGKVRPLDSLVAADGKDALGGLGLLIMAQPRPLSPQENVALDGWVRGGGRLLMFADPMLTAQSSFAFGDRRRPEAIAMLSPILARWGLRLDFDDEQVAGLRNAEVLGVGMPVDLPGKLVADARSDCVMLAEGLLANCRIGRGHALIVADAALLEQAPEAEIPARRIALQHLIDAARNHGAVPGN